MKGPLTLRIAAAVEAASLAILLTNLVTVHLKPVTSLLGPTHGTAYLIVILTTLTSPFPAAVRRRALIPGIGGLLALRRLHDQPLAETGEA
ncbi:hypothetical protein ACGF0J_25090 [Nonomuraea sp. NPDC047897]|uniref:hypothetical protein n=1 Tax=Nonomuraea sp. NPDC047897 TaxID=3364346 RepID=UPI0037108FE7